MSSEVEFGGPRRAGRLRAATAGKPVWPGMIPPPQPRRRHALPRRRHHRGMMVGSVAAIGTAAVAGGVVLARIEATAQRAAPESVASTADLTLGGGPDCAPTRTAGLVRGNGTGSTTSGPDVILAFQHAYYIARSGTLARAVTTPDAWVSPPQVIDLGIATIPRGTLHCVQITPLLDGRFDVQVAESRPDRSARTYRQLVTVADRDGKTLISRIDAPARPQ
ncbi:hypothetical protein NDR87_02680 [Nocardia sp. CDC159]|uniref:DUF8176 domain-containing protein n=1 Tax=Nocardia pulmonis TaxID=2951408 RepID=A0A9X2E134_9NOCA|nr:MULTISPECIES: hypothetical protein [Nocardia]MCM6772082.1 hypothetical protein [Nocardia pulmonis]MCM6785260.1 hypothetical protein [Nocardia sp. CDC159]